MFLYDSVLCEGNTVINKVDLGAYIEEHVPSLKHFMTSETQREFCIPSLMALSSSMRMLQRFEFKMNHGEWVSLVKPEFGPGISERIEEAIRVSDEKIDLCRLVKTELLTALSTLLGVQTSSYFSQIKKLIQQTS